MTKQNEQLFKAWCNEFKDQSPVEYMLAMDHISKPWFSVEIIHSNETGEFVWAVQVAGTEFRLDSFKTKKQAVKFCKDMKWRVVK